MSGRQLMTLSNKHKQLARLLVQGHTQSEAARLIGLHKSTVCRLMREPLVINESIGFRKKLIITHHHVFLAYLSKLKKERIEV